MSRRKEVLVGRFGLPIVAIVFAGCSSTYHYEIALRPDGDAIEREITVWKSANSNGKMEEFPKESLTEIAKAYGATIVGKLDQKHTFKGRFDRKMPIDVQNSGTYSHWTSPFGSASLYMERFGGNDNIVGQIDARRKACNRLTDMLIAWLEGELGKEPKWNELRQFLDTQFRHDLQNLTLTFLASGRETFSEDPASPDKGQMTPFVRLLQYIVERGYIEASELPGFMYSRDVSAYIAWANRFLGAKLGYADDAARPESMAFLKDIPAAGESWTRYLRTTSEYKELLADWEVKNKNAKEEARKNSPDAPEPPDSPMPEPSEAVSKLIGQATFEFELFADSTEVSISMSVPSEPIVTNGVWDADKRQVRWKTYMHGKEGLPTFVTASWSEPNEDEQKARFGKVLLVKDDLYPYVMWYAALSEQDKTEWDSFIASLHPGENLIPKLEQFRFTGDPPIPANTEEGKPPSHADTARAEILNKLRPTEDREIRLERADP